MSAREEILGRIRTALGADRPEPAAIPRDYRLTDGRTPAELLDVLTDRLEDYKATVVRCAPSDVAATVAGALRTALGEHAPGDVVVAPGVPADWRPDGAAQDDGRPAVALADYAATVAGVSVAIAETGTLVLDGSPVCGRRALSLLPDCLICVVPAEQVVGGVPEGLARLDPLAPLTMISGPSATSDIELQRVEGVHGPRTLLVVLVDG
ncbi:LutC/YkgG family protein [Blastococcus mobilis]|uniref:L-lactate dehydrogenase complex protein LldG n=1 Tax=Blastococcus mobilis TaxID=1938746 RepID=A0A238UPU8_9ACTN|nr:LUD domain-containing protein [Blastococcus mobilis]SNR24008.1 L-lactate dehydrogenase complex protein LldG [Blastococcus mobilis]